MHKPAGSFVPPQSNHPLTGATAVLSLSRTRQCHWLCAVGTVYHTVMCDAVQYICRFHWLMNKAVLAHGLAE